MFNVLPRRCEIRAGKLRALAVTGKSRRRAAGCADHDRGGVPGYTATT